MQGSSTIHTTASGAQVCEIAELFEVPEYRIQTSDNGSFFSSEYEKSEELELIVSVLKRNPALSLAVDTLTRNATSSVAPESFLTLRNCLLRVAKCL